LRTETFYEDPQFDEQGLVIGGLIRPRRNLVRKGRGKHIAYWAHAVTLALSGCLCGHP